MMTYSNNMIRNVTIILVDPGHQKFQKRS